MVTILSNHQEYLCKLLKRFSTATQFLERQSIATHIALLDKKRSYQEVLELDARYGR
jgi:hypothetical protein